MISSAQIKKCVAILGLVCGMQPALRAQSITPQNMEKLQIMEDSLLITADSMFNAPITETHLLYSERFVRQLVKTLKIPNSCMYPFNKLGEVINIIYPDDNAFRMFNWEIEFSAIGKRYYGAIQMPSEQLKLYGLLDYTPQLAKGAEDSVLTNGKWYGALYYDIKTNEVNGQKVYTLFGFSAAGMASNVKLLDALTFNDKGTVFGAPIFGIGSTNFPRQPIVRFIQEYKKGVTVTLKWDPANYYILTDNLTSEINDPSRKYTYVPSGQYDALRWSNGMWNYIQDIAPIKMLSDGQAPSDADEQQQNQNKKGKKR